jgi:tetratricopeptide (TPR) repeat protein
MMTPEQFLSELQNALDDYRFKDAAELAARIDPSGFKEAQIKKALNLLRRKRQFHTMEHLAGTFLGAGFGYPVIHRQWAQSLLDQSRVSQALPALRSLAKQYADHTEGPELLGLVGRACKQLYVDEGGEENLREAIAAYQQGWHARRGDYRWHGINYAALCHRAIKDGVPTQHPEAVAREILADIEEKDTTSLWDYATAFEAWLALDDEKAALGFLAKYVRHPDADAFELASTLRQLKEVWKLAGTPFGAQILPVLEYELLQREGARLTPTSTRPVDDTSGFEAVYGNEAGVHVQWLDSLYACFSAVARLAHRRTGERGGTAFLLPGNVLKAEWGDAPVLLTNSHVVSTNPSESKFRPEDVEAEFTRLKGRPKVRVKEVLFSSPPLELDVTVLRLEPPVEASVLELTQHAPVISADPEKRQRVYVFGHANGDELVVSMYDNHLVELLGHRVRYRAPTEPGSSGSPVCSRELQVFAIHHAAVASQSVNEGIILAAIRAALG